MYDIILFDLDDTLLDFSGSETKSLLNIHQDFYKSVEFSTFEAQFKTINRALWARVGAKADALRPSDVRLMRFEQLNEALGLRLSTTSVAKAYEASLGDEAEWIPGVQSAIKFLHEKGHVLGIITNGVISVQDRKYQRHQLGQWFDCYIVSDRVGASKPHRAIFDSAFKDIASKHKLAPEALKNRPVIMVGDSIESDGHGASNSALDFCFINPKERDARHHGIEIKHDIQSVADLPACLGYTQ